MSPFLQSLAGAFYPSLCLRAVGVDGFDAQLPCRPRELGFGFRVRIFGVDAEDAVAVRVKRGRYAVRQNVVM